MKTEKYSHDYIKKLIDENQNNKALEILNHISDKSIWSQNAHAVCLMRLNSFKAAIQVLTPVVFLSNSIAINSEVPDKVKLNLAEAMLLFGNVAGAAQLISACKDDCQSRNKLEIAIKRWKKSQSICSRLMILLGILPLDKPIAVEPPFGEV
jgi:hypothetical protein